MAVDDRKSSRLGTGSMNSSKYGSNVKILDKTLILSILRRHRNRCDLASNPLRLFQTCTISDLLDNPPQIEASDLAGCL